MRLEMMAIVHSVFGTFRTARAFALCCLLVPGLQFTDPNALAAEQSARCKKNPKLATEQYAETLKNTNPNLSDPIFKTVPSDLKVAPDKTHYIITEPTELYELPIEGALTTAILKYGYRFSALCRVQGLVGDWWIVARTPGSLLAYVPASKTERAREYDARARKEIEARQKQNDQR
jgi:hypothetical protein